MVLHLYLQLHKLGLITDTPAQTRHTPPPHTQAPQKVTSVQNGGGKAPEQGQGRAEGDWATPPKGSEVLRRAVSKAGRVAPGVARPHPTEAGKLFRSVLGTLLRPSAVSFGIGASQPAEPQETRRSIRSATFDYLCYSAVAPVSLPAANHV